MWDNQKPGEGHAQSRLNSPLCWSADINDDKQWMMLPLGDKARKVAGTVVLARADDYGQWIETYKVSYSMTGDDGDWKEVPEFVGTGERYGVCQALFPSIVEAKYIKLHPLTWSNAISTRADVLILTGTAKLTP